eukprot:3623239-Alexandrium_andersonii.AAC.1
MKVPWTEVEAAFGGWASGGSLSRVVLPGGEPSSSTRMEALGGLLAMHTPGAVEIRTDSRAVVERHRSITLQLAHARP